MRKFLRPAGRGVIALVKGLRDMGDEKLDKGLEMFQKIDGDYAPRSKSPQLKILVDDDPRLDILLGPEAAEESENNEIEKETGKRRQPTKDEEEERLEAMDEKIFYKTKLRCIANAHLGHMSQGHHILTLKPLDLHAI